MPKRLLIALLAMIAAVPLLAISSAPASSVAVVAASESSHLSDNDDFSVLTYNVKGLPWPIARGREEAFDLIENRLAAMRAHGTQPRILVLQEAFTDRAKQIGGRSGYRYSAAGPSKGQIASANIMADSDQFPRKASILKGETEGKWLDSGLVVFSDYPISSVKSSAFPASACAGYDCLANKGALLVEIQTPGQDMPVTLVTTHLNSRRGARVSEAQSLRAYTKQVAFLSNFVRKYRKADSPLIFAGDFNASSAARREALVQASFLSDLASANPSPPSALDALRKLLPLSGKIADEAAYISTRGRDWQFFMNGKHASIEPLSLSIPFGREKDGTMLSDHLGFSIAYRIGESS